MQRKRPLPLFPLLTGVLLSLCASGHSSVLLFPPDDFPNSDWSVRAYGSPLVESTALQGEQWLAIGRTASNNGSAQYAYNAGYTNQSGTPIVDPANQLGNIQGSVILGASDWGDSRGIILRSVGTGFTDAGVSNAYYLAVTSGSLRLVWNVGDEYLNSADVVTLTSSTYSASLGTLTASNNNQYLLEFSAIGMQFDAALWALDGNGDKLGNALASISYLDERAEARESGFFALRGGRYGGDRTSYFRDLELNVIPEPSLTSLLLFGLGIGATKKWCSRKRR